MALTWIDPSPSTGTTAGWIVNGSITWDVTEAALKYDGGASGVAANIVRAGILGAAFTCSFRVKFETLPSGNGPFWDWWSAAFAGTGHNLRVWPDGSLSIHDVAFSAAGLITTGVWYEFLIAGSVTSTTVNRLVVWLDGAEVFDVENMTLGAALPDIPVFGWDSFGTLGADRRLFLKDIVTFNDNNSFAYRQLRTTRKRPAAAGTSGFDTGIGSGTNRWDRVSERPISETNGWREATPAAPSTERMPPDAVLASAGLSGATVANLDDDPDSGGTDFATATSNNTAVSVRVSFATPSITPSGTQEFRAQVRKNAASGTGTPTAQIDLYENGVLISAGTPVSVTSTTGQVISRTWDMTGRTASQIEALVSGTASGGSPGARASVDIGAIEWNATALAAGVLETYQLEGASAGDVDISGDTLVGRLAWVWAKASAAGAAQLVDNGAETAISLTTTSAFYSVLSTSATYPAGTDQIGLRAVAGDTDTDLYECGTVLAYTPAAPAGVTAIAPPVGAFIA